MNPPAPRSDAASLAAALEAWYAEHARVLPWRTDPTPYRVLLSEFMLQQTRVETVIDRFHRFLERWPTLEALAAATEGQVVEEWAGLGYYNRARRLHRAARQAVEAGGLPSSPSDLRELPGVGPYTAGAIASIAFGVAAPLVDGNVERVLSRVDARTADPKKAAGRRALWERAGELVEHARAPGDLNQGLMELGATLCTPTAPDCGRCPWGEQCLARARGIQEALPERTPRKKPTPVRGAAGILWHQRRVLMGQRPVEGLLGGLWEPVGGDLGAEQSADRGLQAAWQERAGLAVRVGRRLGQVVHTFSHRKLTLEVFEVHHEAPEPDPGAFYQRLRWVDPAEPEGVGLSTLARRTLDLALDPPAQTSLLAADRPAE